MSNYFDLLKLGTLCNNPKVIITQDNRRMLIPCGKCLSCLSQKANQRKRVLMSEFLSHKYALFVTLTYKDANIPLMDLVKVEGFPCLYDCYSICTGEFLLQTKITKSELSKIRAKSNHNGYIPYCETSDLQKYLKRVRKNLSKYSDEKLRYYAVSEMGQLHYRPHFHLLFFFDKTTTFCNLRKICVSSWSFGHVDTQLPKDKRASSRYLSQYLNSTLSLPPIFKEGRIKPRVFHSSHLGFVIDSVLAEAVKEQDYKRVVEYGARRMGELWSDDIFPKWRSLENYLFPKCKGYSLFTDIMRLRTYNLYPYLRTKYFEGRDVTCREIADYVYELYNNDKLNEYEQNRIFTAKVNEEIRVPVKENFLAQLYCSRHFARLCSWLCVSESRLLSIINGYYQFVERYNLVKWYELLQEVSAIGDYDIYVHGAAYINLFTDDTIDINGIIFETSELRNELNNDDFHNFANKVFLSMQQSALKHRQQNEYYIKELN